MKNWNRFVFIVTMLGMPLAARPADSIPAGQAPSAAGARPAPTPSVTERSKMSGVDHAARIQRLQKDFRESWAKSDFRGFLLTEGDSWFDYPVYGDAVNALKHLGYKVENVAHFGDTLESMAYQDDQLLRLSEKAADMAQDRKVPRAILLSAGGNDLIHEFQVYINHHNSNLGPVNAALIEALFTERLLPAAIHWISAAQEISRSNFGKALPVLVHGYGPPVPDGRGYPILGLAGPWLKPVFDEKGWPVIDDNRLVMSHLIEILNDRVMQQLPKYFPDGAVVYVDLRKALPTGGDYKHYWNDEMHPTPAGFEAVGKIFDVAIQKLATP